MKMPRLLSLAILALLAFSGGFQEARGQWASLKAALQGEVRILEESETRLVLCREDSSATLIVTYEQSSDADIFAGVEARRGGNPYRVWVMTENFWRKPHLAADGGRRFFQPAFAGALRFPNLQAPLPAINPESEPQSSPETTQPLSIESLAAEPRQPQQMEEEAATRLVVTDTLRNVSEPTRPRTSARAPAARRAVRGGSRSHSAARPSRAPAAPQPPQPRAAHTPAPAPLVAVAPAAPAYARLDSLYQSALVEMQKENWQAAVTVLEKLQSQRENYLDAATLLAQAQAKLHPEVLPAPVASRSSSSPSIFTGGAVAALGAFVALIVLPMLGVVFLSTGFRAHFHLFRGNHVEAARLFEKKLARRPGKTKLYAELANVYLLLGRRDEEALRVYKMVLQLKLRTKNREAITALVAQNYLAEGRNDANMIEILENALKSERRKLGQGPAPEK